MRELNEVYNKLGIHLHFSHSYDDDDDDDDGQNKFIPIVGPF